MSNYDLTTKKGLKDAVAKLDKPDAAIQAIIGPIGFLSKK